MFCQFCGQVIQIQFTYCPFCGQQISAEVVNEEEVPVMPVNDEEWPSDGATCDEIIQHYFNRSFSYKNIMQFMSKYHGINISLRTLHTKLRELGLRRRNKEYNMNFVRQRVQQELDGPGSSGGYRAVWHTLQTEGYQVTREAIRVILKELDPEGVQERRARTLRRRTYYTPGPNHSWHVDGYDKLKPYGFPIHGCIDGYSRKILWLKVSRTNNDPAITSQFYLDAVRKYGGCPTIMRTDNGTENIIMAAMQSYLRSSGDDEFAGVKAHRYGTSPANQRIECWWSFLRKNRSNWWINLFKDLVEAGHLSLSNQLQKECLWFCFHQLLQQDLTSVQRHWNSHYIRKSRFDTVAGRPDELYFLPESSDSQDYIKDITDDAFQEMSQYCHDYEEDSVFQEYFQVISQQLNQTSPTSWRQALNMYDHLCQSAQD